MAITKETVLKKIEVLYNSRDANVQVFYIDKFDDPNDDHLPVQQPRTCLLSRYDQNGDATDYSGCEPEVVAICDLIWTDAPVSDGE